MAKEHVWRVGDMVTYVPSFNGVGEGIVWRVTKVHMHKPRPLSAPRVTKLRIEPCFTLLTGPSVRKPTSVMPREVKLVTAFDIGLEYQRLGELVKRQLAHECGIEEE